MPGFVAVYRGVALFTSASIAQRLRFGRRRPTATTRATALVDRLVDLRARPNTMRGGCSFACRES
jgi:hypothetical protein